MRDLLRGAFFRPPSGGNGRGVPIVNQMKPMSIPRFPDGPKKDNRGAYDGDYPVDYTDGTSGPGAQGSVADMFDAGIRSADTQAAHSSRVGATEFRNYLRGTAQRNAAVVGTYPATVFDEEAALEGSGRPGSDPVPNGPGPLMQVNPQYQPARGGSVPRSDGRK